MADIELRAQFVDQASEGVAKLAENLKRLGEAYIGFEGIKKLVENITEAQEAVLELDRLFRSFGDTVGVTKQNMLDYATAIQNSTALSDEAVIKGQAALLKYTSITGEEFKRVRDIAVDVAATMGGDVASAADALGRALENPLQGMRILRQLGVVLSPEQQALAKNMVETGRAAQVQGFLLAELEKRYKGAAEEATNTLGGALTQLKNKLTDAFEGQGADVDGLTKAIKDLGEEVSKPEFREAVSDLVKLFVGFATAIVKAVEKVDQLIGQMKRFADASPAFAAALKLIPGVAALGGISDIAGYLNGPEKPAGGAVPTAGGDDGGLRDYLNKIYGGTDGLKGPILLTAKEQAEAAKKALEELTKQTKDFLALISSADTNTQTAQEKIDAANDKFLEDVKFLLENNAISREEANARIADFLEQDLTKATNAAGGRRLTVPKEEITEYQRLALSAAKSIQSAFADMFYNMGNGARGFLQSMLDVFKRILAEALALDLTKALKLDQLGKSGGGSGGSVFGSIIGGVIGYFTGHADGTSQMNGPAIVGERGPELFIPPGFGGSIIPNHSIGGMGGLVYSPVTTIHAAPETDMNKLMAVISINNDRQRNEIMRMLYDNGFGRMR